MGDARAWETRPENDVFQVIGRRRQLLQRCREDVRQAGDLFDASELGSPFSQTEHSP